MIIGLRGNNKAFLEECSNELIKNFDFEFFDLAGLVNEVMINYNNLDVQDIERTIKLQNDIDLKIVKALKNKRNKTIIVDLDYINNPNIMNLVDVIIDCNSKSKLLCSLEKLSIIGLQKNPHIIVDLAKPIWRKKLIDFIDFNLYNDKLVSVVVPIYNVDKYLETCINSIRNQSYKNLEIILINDGSTDSSLEICEKFAAIDKRIKVINQKNKGLAETRNVGIENSIGEFITFIDSDDYIENDMIQTLLFNITKYNADVSHGRAILHARDGKVYGEKTDEKDVNFVNDLGEILHRFTTGSISIAAWDKLYRKSSIENIRFKSDVFKEDLNFIYQLCMEKKSFVCDTGKYYHYVKRDSDSLTASFSESMFALVDWGKNVQKEILLKNGSLHKEYADKCLYFCLANILRLFARDFKMGKIKNNQYNEQIQNVVNEFTNLLFNSEDITIYDDLNNILEIINLLLETKIIKQDDMPFLDVECIGILWNTMSGNLVQEAINIISSVSEFFDYEICNIKEYEKFIREIYLHNHEVEGVAYMKACTLVDKYDTNDIIIINAIFKVSNFLYLNAKKGYVYKELAELKKKIRKEFKSKIRDYTYDTVFHMTMDKEEYEYTDQVVRKYCNKYKGYNHE